MSAGDSTLNALTALQTMKVMQQVDADLKLDPSDLRAHVMENYVKFLTTPGTNHYLSVINSKCLDRFS